MYAWQLTTGSTNKRSVNGLAVGCDRLPAQPPNGVLAAEQQRILTAGHKPSVYEPVPRILQSVVGSPTITREGCVALRPSGRMAGSVALRAWGRGNAHGGSGQRVARL